VKLKLTYDIVLPWDDEEDADEEDEEEKDDTDPKQVTLKVVVSVLRVDDTCHCVDWKLKSYKLDD